MAFSEDLSHLVSRDNLLLSLQKATGRAEVQICGDPRVKWATEGMEGVTSTILRVEVDYRFEEDSTVRSMALIVKCLPQIETQLEIVEQCRVFLREGVYFDKVVPLIENVSLGKAEVPLPKCYVSIYGGENDALYMEDLTTKGFRTPEFKYRQEGLDLAHFVVALKNLGRLHGLMVAGERAIPSGKSWLEFAPALSKEALFYSDVPGEPPNLLKGMTDGAVYNLLHFSRKIDGLPKEAEASGMLEKVAQKIWGTMCRLTQPDSKGRNILNHGDCWMNNMMFRYEKDEHGVEKPVDSKFIDLQISRYCHPSIDILHFLHMCAAKPIRDNHMNRLINYYYDTMLDTLKTLEAGPPPLTLDELFDDLNAKYKPYGVIIGILFAPILFLGDFVPPKVEDMTPELFKEMFETGNAPMARVRFDIDPIYRSKIVDNVREFVDTAFPCGLKSVDKSPLLI